MDIKGSFSTMPLRHQGEFLDHANNNPMAGPSTNPFDQVGDQPAVLSASPPCGMITRPGVVTSTAGIVVHFKGTTFDLSDVGSLLWCSSHVRRIVAVISPICVEVDVPIHPDVTLESAFAIQAVPLSVSQTPLAAPDKNLFFGESHSPVLPSVLHQMLQPAAPTVPVYDTARMAQPTLGMMPLVAQPTGPGGMNHAAWSTDCMKELEAFSLAFGGRSTNTALTLELAISDIVNPQLDSPQLHRRLALQKKTCHNLPELYSFFEKHHPQVVKDIVAASKKQSSTGMEAFEFMNQTLQKNYSFSSIMAYAFVVYVLLKALPTRQKIRVLRQHRNW